MFNIFLSYRKTKTKIKRHLRNRRKCLLEAAIGIEPMIKVLQTFALPLGYAAISARTVGVEPTPEVLETSVLPLNYALKYKGEKKSTKLK